MMSLGVGLIMLPALRDDPETVFGVGAAIYPLVWISIAGAILQTFFFAPVMAPYMALLPVEIAKFTTTLTETYMSNVKSTMLASLDVVEEPTRAMFAKLSKDQATVETWAHHLNDGMSTYYGIMLTMTVAWVFLPIVLMGVFMGSSEFGAGGIACLSILALMPVKSFLQNTFFLVPGAHVAQCSVISMTANSQVSHKRSLR